MTSNPNELARAGAKALESYFASRGASPVTAGDGRYTIYVPGGSETENLQLSLASTPAARGILGRVKARRVIEPANWARAAMVANHWNRSNPLPHAVLATSGDGEAATGSLFLEGFLPPAAVVDEDQVRRFTDSLVAGSRVFWSSETVRNISSPLPLPAGAEAPVSS
jgi:hypothetical protein